MSRYPSYPNEALEHYWRMWNSLDPDQARHHLDLAVTEDVVFCDPRDHHVGREALAHNVRRFRRRFPRASFEIRSGFDTHHNRSRYRWDLLVDGEVLVEGTDVATVADNGLLERIDGFFGPLPPVQG